MRTEETEETTGTLMDVLLRAIGSYAEVVAEGVEHFGVVKAVWTSDGNFTSHVLLRVDDVDMNVHFSDTIDVAKVSAVKVFG